MADSADTAASFPGALHPHRRLHRRREKQGGKGRTPIVESRKPFISKKLFLH